MRNVKILMRVAVMAAFCILVFSCGSRRKIVYVNNIENTKYQEKGDYETVLQPDDLLSIQVIGQNEEVTQPFNLPELGQNNEQSRNLRVYLVDKEGNIDFPTLGKVKLGGMTRAEAKAKLLEMLSEYIVNPSIVFNIVNFKVSVLGEVVRPGTFDIASERVTLFEALAMAGDMTIYGRRDNVLLIRENDGKKTHVRLNLTDGSFMESPYYYLAQNDVIYVEPNPTKIHSSTIGPDIYIVFSGISLLTTLFVILSR